DIGIARRTEHHRVALGPAAEGMRCGIGVVIGLDFDDGAANAFEQQRCPDEIGGNNVHAAGKETSAKEAARWHRVVSTGNGSGGWHAAMKIFLAGASGAIGRRLVPLLLQAGHKVTGTTRTAEKAHALERAGVVPAVLDMFDAGTVTAAMGAAKPEVVIH